MKRSNFLFCLILVLIVLPFYLAGLFIGVHAGGDLPFFYPENLVNLTYPWAWVNSPGPNGLGFSNTATLWLYVPFLLFGLIYQFFQIDFTYTFPLALVGFLVLSAYSIVKFCQIFQISFVGRLIAASLYLINSYVLLLIDGGQIIFALGYALLPLFIYITISALQKKKLYLSLLSSILLSILIGIDIRVALLAALFLAIFLLFHIDILYKNTKFIIFTGALCVLIPFLIHSYWLIPLLVQSQGSIPFINNFGLSNLSFIRLDDALLLHQPQWPNNIFGEVQPATAYFSLLPLLVFVNLLYKQTRLSLVLNITAIVAIFLAKGSNPPLGEINTFLYDHLPFFNLFRDPSKFFVLLCFCFATLSGLSYDLLIGSLKRFKFAKENISVCILLTIFAIAIILPVSDGYYKRLNGLLSWTVDSSKISSFIANQEGFFRSLWINQKPQLAFSDNQRPALDIKALSENPLIRSISLDDYDLSSFLRTDNGREILKLSGVKLLFFDDVSNAKLSENERRENLISFLDKQRWMTKRFSENVYFETKSINDRFTFLNNIILVNGGLDLYNYLANIDGFSLSNNGFIFLSQISEAEVAGLNTFFLTDQDDVNTNYDLLSFQKEGVLSIADQGGWGKTNVSGDLWNKLLRENSITSVNYYPISTPVFYSTISSESFELGNVKREDDALLVQLFSNRRGGSVEFASKDERFLVNTKKDLDRFEWFEIPIVQDGIIRITNKGGFNAIGRVITKPMGKAAEIQANRVYLINVSGNRALKFYENRLYKALVFSNSLGRVNIKKGPEVLRTAVIDKTSGWKDVGLINLADINSVTVEGSQSGRLLLDKEYSKSEVDRNRGTRIIYKEIDRKEVGVEWNSIKTEKVDVLPNSVLNIELSKDITLRAHLFKGDVEAFEVEVPTIKDGLKLVVPHGFNGIKFELLWPKNSSQGKFILKATYEGDQETSLLLLPQELSLDGIFTQEQKAITWRYINPTKYEVQNNNGPGYLLFSERYNPNWEIRGHNYQGKSVQTHALLNGFFMPRDGSYTVEYATQRLVDKYIYLSMAVFIITSLLIALFYRKDI